MKNQDLLNRLWVKYSVEDSAIGYSDFNDAILEAMQLQREACASAGREYLRKRGAYEVSHDYFEKSILNAEVL